MNPEPVVRFLPFPNRAARAAVMPNDEGSYDILVNTLYPEEAQRLALEHELEHLRREHLSRGDSVVLLEAEARGEEAALKSICCYTPAGPLEEFVPTTGRGSTCSAGPGSPGGTGTRRCSFWRAGRSCGRCTGTLWGAPTC